MKHQVSLDEKKIQQIKIASQLSAVLSVRK